MEKKKFSISGMVSANPGWRAVFQSRSRVTGEVTAIYLKTIIAWAWGTEDTYARSIFPVILDYGSPFVLVDDDEFYGCLAPGQDWNWQFLENEGVNGVFEWIDRPGFEEQNKA